MVQTYTDTFAGVLSKIAAAKVDVAPSKFDVVDEEGIFKLLKYQPVTERQYRTPVVIVYAFINRPYVLDLQPEISVVQKYLQAGFDVYMLDWGYPGVADRFLNLDDYAGFLERSLRRVTRAHGVKAVNLHGYCLGGTLSAAYTALNQGRVRNLILQAAPIEFHTENLIARWARAIDPDKIVDAFGLASGSFLNFSFLLVDPVNLTYKKYAGFLEAPGPEQEIASFLRMDHWVFDSPSIPGETFRQYIKEWYHDNSLIKGTFRLLGETVDLNKISVPVLVLAAKHDHIVPPEAQKAVLGVISSQDKDVYEVDKGHIGITTSRNSHKEYWPRAVRWIEQRSEPEA